MESSAYGIALVSGIAVIGVTFVACQWWYGRRVRELLMRLAHTEQQRRLNATDDDSAMLMPLMPTTANDSAAPGFAATLIPPIEPTPTRPRPATSDDSARSPNDESADDLMMLRALPAHGFADTLPMCVRPITRPPAMATTSQIAPAESTQPG